MSQVSLSSSDLEVIRQCLVFVLRSGALEGEFKTRLGVDDSEVEALLQHWPNGTDPIGDTIASRAVSNSLNEVCNGIALPQSEWAKWFSVPREAVQGVFERWQSQRVAGA